MKQIVTFQDSNYKVANFWWSHSESQQTLKIRDKEISSLLIFSFTLTATCGKEPSAFQHINIHPY